MASKSDQHPTILADLRGVRFILASEPEDGRRFNEGLLKQITGGEKIVARRMREDFSRFDSTAKLWIMGNHKPNIRGTDNAIWRRINLIPFNVTIPKEKQDKDLWVKLEAEQEGILLWMEKGRRNWLKNGLNPPDEVLIATQEYRNEMDVIQDFINEHVEEDLGNWLLHASLYGAYAKSASDTNERVLSSKMFAQKMREKGYQDARRPGNHLYWQNITLKNFNDSVQRDL
jgi:putative DNA primase/helicase